MSAERPGGHRFSASFNDRWLTVGGMIDDGVDVYVTCGTCLLHRPADLAGIEAHRGWDFSLVNMRSRCREPGCAGWVSFWVKQGMRYIPLADRALKQRWMFGKAEQAEAAG